MSLRDQRRILQALFTLTKGKPGATASIGAINRQLGRAADDIRGTLGMLALVEAGQVEVSDDQATITRAGAEAIGEVLP